MERFSNEARPVIVMLPGMDGTGLMFAEFASILQSQFQVRVLDYPVTPALGYEELAGIVMQRLPVGEPFILLGESFAGPLAIAIAAVNPPGLRGLVLCCTFVRNPLPVLRPLRRLIDVLPLHARWSGLFAPMLFGRYRCGKLQSSLQEALKKVPVATMRARLRAVLDVDYSKQLAGLRMPVLYLQAREDLIVPTSALRELLLCLPTIETKTMPGPHMLLQAQAKDAASVVEEFAQRAATAGKIEINA